MVRRSVDDDECVNLDRASSRSPPINQRQAPGHSGECCAPDHGLLAVRGDSAAQLRDLGGAVELDPGRRQCGLDGAAGEVASAAVIESLRAYDMDARAGALLEVLGHAATETNAEVARRAAEDPVRFGMGTTLTARLWSGNPAALVHIGDSRAFRFRDGQPGQITADHVLGNFASNAGPWRRCSRAISTAARIDPLDLDLRDLRTGNRYLICSDGLTPVVSTKEIGAFRRPRPIPPTPYAS